MRDKTSKWVSPAGDYVFVVNHPDHKFHSKFIDKLARRGYIAASYNKGVIVGCNWTFVNPISKVYGSGIGGVMVTKPVMQERITADDFFALEQALNENKPIETVLSELETKYASKG